MEWTVSLSPKRVTTTLTVIACCLTLASVVGNIMTYFPGNIHTYSRGRDFPLRNQFVLLFGLDLDHTIPAWYESSLFLVCSILLAMIARTAGRDGVRSALPWAVLSVLFLSLSLDKMVRLHAVISESLCPALSRKSILVASSLLIAAFVLAYLRFLDALPAPIRRLMLIATALFTGALGMDRVGESYAIVYSEQHMAAALFGDVEGLLEMLSVVVFMHELLAYLSGHIKAVTSDEKVLPTPDP